MSNFYWKNKQKAFTLTELLTIILIISILATLMFPHLRKALSDAKVADCMNNQRQFATMIQTYYVEWKQFPFPDPNGSALPTEGLLPYGKLTPEYTSAYNKRWCPESRVLYLYEVNDERDNFTISCTAGHALLGISAGHPRYVFAGGLFKEANN